MSATCPRADARGFTLLELVVVLTIMGLAAAMAAPSLLRGIESWRVRDTIDRVADQIHGLPARARISGRPILLGKAADAKDAGAAAAGSPFDVEPGWTVTIPKAWTVRGNGYCEGGDVVIVHEAREWTLRATAPFCDVETAR